VRPQQLSKAGWAVGPCRSASPNSLSSYSSYSPVSFWATVCKTVCLMLSDCCMSCLPVTLFVAKRLDESICHFVGLGPRHIVLYGDPAPPQEKGEAQTPPHTQFSAHVCCGQTAGWIKLSLGTEVGLSKGQNGYTVRMPIGMYYRIGSHWRHLGEQANTIISSLWCLMSNYVDHLLPCRY